jgi:hypothetical protein
MTDPDVGPADATQDDALVEETPTAYPDDVPADHPTDPTYVPAPEYDEGLEVSS